MRTLFSAVVFFVALAVSPIVFAQQQAVEQFAESGELAPLKGAEILSMERTPIGTYVTDIESSVEGTRVRIPIVLDKQGAKWSVLWSPKSEFLSALANVIKAGALPKGGERRWTSDARIPALPIVVTNKRYVTPFGVAAPAAEPNLSPNGALLGHVKEWLSKVYGEDPAPAAFDVIAASNTEAIRVAEVVATAAQSGLYLVSLIGQSSSDLTYVRMAAPVGSVVSGESPPEIVAGVSPTADGFGLRVVRDRKLVDSAIAACPGMTACAPVASEFSTTLQKLVSPGQRVLIAFAPNVPVSDMFTLTGITGPRTILAHIVGVQ